MSESITQEADQIVHLRGAEYGHPAEDFTRSAELISIILSHKLKDPIRAIEVGLIMMCIKISREVNAHKRDNLVDIAGYAQTCEMVHEHALKK